MPMPDKSTHTGVLIAGPTASGKSRLALALAEALEPFGGATIINSDSMQVYRDLRILTARPSRDDEDRAPHRLYGVFPSNQRCSAGRWCVLAGEAISKAHSDGRMPVVVGGTGLYFQALVEGLAPVPDIPPAVREQGSKRLDQLGNVPFHEELSRKDPLMAERIRPSDRRRMVRAWEVIEATGISLVEWQRRHTGTHCPGRFAKIVLSVPRETLYARCDGRFEEMATSGAVDEVRGLLAQAVPASHPVMKAVGVRELARYLSGEDTLDGAVAAGQRSTRRYAKRQMTWFRNRMADWRQFPAQDLESFFPEIFSFIRQSILTL